MIAAHVSPPVAVGGFGPRAGDVASFSSVNVTLVPSSLFSTVDALKLIHAAGSGVSSSGHMAVILQKRDHRYVFAQRGVLNLHLGGRDHLPGQIGKLCGFVMLDFTGLELGKYLRQFGA